MSMIGEVQQIMASRKARLCDWCNDDIEVGQPARRYRWKDGSDVVTVRMHPECFDASQDLASREGGECEWTPGDFSRGCCCINGGCECEPPPSAQGDQP